MSDYTANVYLTDYNDIDKEDLETIGSATATATLTQYKVTFAEALQSAADRANGEKYTHKHYDAYCKATFRAREAIKAEIQRKRSVSWFVTLGHR